MTLSKKNINVLITGCSKGFGLLFADKLASEGYKVYATYRDASKAASLKEIAKKYSNIHLFELDVNCAEQILTLKTFIEREDGKLNVLINNAGYGLMGLLNELSTEKLKEQFATNVFAPIELSKLFMTLLSQSENGGLIINISSIASYLGLPAFGAYSSSKAALNNLSMSLACENASSGLSVAVIEPGPFETNFRESVVQVGDVDKYQSARSKLCSGREDPGMVSDLVSRLIKQKLTGKLPSFQEIPIGKNTHLFRLLMRWLPQEWIVKFIATETSK